jgi:hypothetical protein
MSTWSPSRYRTKNVSGTAGAYCEALRDVKGFGLRAVGQNTSPRCPYRSEGSWGHRASILNPEVKSVNWALGFWIQIDWDEMKEE